MHIPIFLLQNICTLQKIEGQKETGVINLHAFELLW